MNSLKTIEDELSLTAHLHNEIKIQSKVIKNMSDSIRLCYKNKHKVLLFGNGGSAADAQHIAAELIGKFKKKRKPLQAIALTTDTSIITAIGNDFGFEYIFSRQCEGLAEKGDVIMAFSTSGNSKNVINGVKVAKKRGCKILGFTGKNGGRLKKFCDHVLLVPSNSTSNIQEIHRTVSHIICGLVEK